MLWEGLPPPPLTCAPLTRPGVGGMRGFTQVRCLHVHAAHALVEGGEANIVGRWVLEALRNGEP